MKLLSLILLVVSLLLATPVLAAERATAIPEPKWPASGRAEYAFVFDGEVVQVARVEFMTGNTSQDIRVHTAEIDLLPNRLTEIVIIGGQQYERTGVETRWRSGSTRGPADVFLPMGNPFAFVSHENSTAYRVGDVTIDGVEMTQYQTHLDVSKLGDPNLISAKEDLFIGKNDGYLYRGQVTYRGRDPQLGEGEYALVFRMFDVNPPVVIGAPPSSLVDGGSIRSASGRSQFTGAQFMPTWAHSFVYRGLQAIRARK
ncbi:MAG: hypothetical protein CYG59_00795 [Chloroflexi bacterium]|nr:MAG: hypothetical protein CYG59_00795 [Chloroflexota bacterium]